VETGEQPFFLLRALYSPLRLQPDIAVRCTPLVRFTRLSKALHTR